MKNFFLKSKFIKDKIQLYKFNKTKKLMILIS